VTPQPHPRGSEWCAPSPPSQDKQKSTVICQGANDQVGPAEVERCIALMPPEVGAAAAAAAAAAGTGAPLKGQGGVQVILLQLELPLEPMLLVAATARARGCGVALKASPLPSNYVAKAEAPRDGPSGRLGGATAGHHGLIRLHLKAWSCPPHS